jgi:outer membrane protein assembly factor BamB
VALPALALLVSGVLTGSSGAATRGCSATVPGGGGDWPSYGGNLAQTNHQDHEDRISPANAGALRVQWVLSADAGQSTPVVSGSCVYVVGGGNVMAADTRTGRLVWSYRLGCTSSLAGYCPAAVHVVHGRVFVDSGAGDSLTGHAFDARTGEPLWHSKPVRWGYPVSQLASAKVARGLSIVFGSGPDFDPHANPGFVLLDERTGRVVYQRAMVPPALSRAGYSAGGVWATPAVDEARGYVYAGTANPYSAKEEAVYSNSIIKIDIDRRRRTFGQVVASYKGDPDVLTQVQYDSPTCSAASAVVTFGPVPCGQTDSDFGAGPTLFTYKGKRYLAEPQKSGVLHVLDPDTMKLRWKATIGLANYTTRLDGNSGEVHFDGRRLYAIGNPGQLHAFDPATGDEAYLTEVFDNPTNYRPLVGGNGVLYVLSLEESALTSWSAADGSLLGAVDLTTVAGSRCSAAQSGGVALAHHQVFVNCGAFLAALSLPG